MRRSSRPTSRSSRRRAPSLRDRAQRELDRLEEIWTTFTKLAPKQLIVDEVLYRELVDRYGEFILLKPRFNAATALLWLAPPLLLIGGIILSVRVIRRRPLRSGDQDGATPTPEEQRRLDKVLRESGSGGQ